MLLLFVYNSNLQIVCGSSFHKLPFYVGTNNSRLYLFSLENNPFMFLMFAFLSTFNFYFVEEEMERHISQCFFNFFFP